MIFADFAYSVYINCDNKITVSKNTFINYHFTNVILGGLIISVSR